MKAFNININIINCCQTKLLKKYGIETTHILNQKLDMPLPWITSTFLNKYKINKKCLCTSSTNNRYQKRKINIPIDNRRNGFLFVCIRFNQLYDESQTNIFHENTYRSLIIITNALSAYILLFPWHKFPFVDMFDAVE